MPQQDKWFHASKPEDEFEVYPLVIVIGTAGVWVVACSERINPKIIVGKSEIRALDSSK